MKDGAPPKLPTSISSNGAEVWDWADKFSAHMQRQDRIRRLKTTIAAIGMRCGDCSKWMKSRECPMEKNVNGYSRGPSMNTPRCGGFVEDRFASRRREELRAELSEVMEPRHD